MHSGSSFRSTLSTVYVERRLANARRGSDSAINSARARVKIRGFRVSLKTASIRSACVLLRRATLVAYVATHSNLPVSSHHSCRIDALASRSCSENRFDGVHFKWVWFTPTRCTLAHFGRGLPIGGRPARSWLAGIACSDISMWHQCCDLLCYSFPM